MCALITDYIEQCIDVKYSDRNAIFFAQLAPNLMHFTGDAIPLLCLQN